MKKGIEYGEKSLYLTYKELKQERFELDKVTLERLYLTYKELKQGFYKGMIDGVYGLYLTYKELKHVSFHKRNLG